MSLLAFSYELLGAYYIHDVTQLLSTQIPEPSGFGGADVSVSVHNHAKRTEHSYLIEKFALVRKIVKLPEVKEIIELVTKCFKSDTDKK